MPQAGDRIDVPAPPGRELRVFTGSAVLAPVELLRYLCQLVPNIFWAVPIVIVVTTRRWNASTVAGALYFLNAPVTALRRDFDAPYLLCRLEIDRCFPKLDELGLLPDLTALAIPDWLAISPISSGSFVPVDACPRSFRFLCEMSP